MLFSASLKLSTGVEFMVHHELSSNMKHRTMNSNASDIVKGHRSGFRVDDHGL